MPTLILPPHPLTSAILLAILLAADSRQQATAERPPAKRRGPKPSISDEALLVAIEADLEASPWEGEGHRKVWARLRVCRGIRVSRKRVLRVMRENKPALAPSLPPPWRKSPCR